jgi:hypothetical protein
VRFRVRRGGRLGDQRLAGIRARWRRRLLLGIQLIELGLHLLHGLLLLLQLRLHLHDLRAQFLRRQRVGIGGLRDRHPARTAHTPTVSSFPKVRHLVTPAGR